MNIFIPESIKQKIVQTLLDFFAEKARQSANEPLARRLAALSPKVEFERSVDQAIQRGIDEAVGRSKQLANALGKLGLERGEVAYILLGELAVLTLAAIPLGLAIGKLLLAGDSKQRQFGQKN